MKNFINYILLICAIFLSVDGFAQGQLIRPTHNRNVNTTFSTKPGNSGSIHRSNQAPMVEISNNGAQYYGIMTDAQQMNIYGSIKKITEISYYTIEAEEMKDQRYEDGGFFDGCAFLSIVYGDEHLARVNFRNFFLQQVSDCEMLFNKDGNLYDLSSLNIDGGHVIVSYNGQKLAQQMDVVERKNAEKEVTDFQYEKESDNLVREIIQIRGYSWGDTINYLYESDRLVRAESSYYVDYLPNGRIGRIRFPRYKKGQDLIINIEYDSNNNIASIDWDKGLYGKAHIEFSYECDFTFNWFERNAIGTIERDSQKIPFSIRTVREYKFY